MSSVYEDFRLYFNLEELVVGDEGGELRAALPVTHNDVILVSHRIPSSLSALL